MGNNVSNLKYLPQAVSPQSILDVFVLQNVIDDEDAETLRSMYKTNRELETFLMKNNLVSRDSINKAYGILLKLPYIELKNVQIPEEAKKIFPENLAKKYGAIPFAFENNMLRLAIARPADMMVGFRTGLTEILQKKNIEIELFITGEEDYIETVKQYRQVRGVLLKKGSLPVVFLRNQKIDHGYLHKLPLEYAKKNRMVVFGQNTAGEYLLAVEKPDDAKTVSAIDILRKENGIKVETFAASREDIDFALKSYADEEEPKEEENTKAGSDKPDEETVKREVSPPTIVEKEPSPKKEKTGLQDLIKNALGVEENGKITVDQVETDAKSTETVDTVLELDPKQAMLRKEMLEKSKEYEDESLGSDGIKIDDIEEIGSIEKKNQAGTTNSGSVDKPIDSKSVDSAMKPNQAVGLAEDKGNINDAKTKEDTSSLGKDNKIESPATLDTESVARDAAGLRDEDIGSLVKEDIKDEKMLAESCKGGYIPKIVASVINYALINRASDIHVEPMTKDLRIRCRVDGVMKEILKLPLSFHPPFVSRIKILSKLKIDEMRIPQDGRFDLVFKTREVDVRVSTLPTVHGEKVVMRILDKSQSILSLEDLGIMGAGQVDIVDAISKPYGIILATGPTGSGKSTTLYAILNRISVPGVNVITLEDPVEYEIPGINQCQVKPEIGFTFAAGLRSVLRQDPNIIMVGEIRDAETANMATHAALTGHLVLSTLHTNDTAGALPRMINMGIEPFLITSAINLIIAQRLVRRICPKCKEEMKVPEKLMADLKAELEKISPKNESDRARIPKELKLFYGKGCSECNKGFKGRIGIYEVMKITPEIENLAIDRRPANEIKDQSIQNGMLTMKQDGILKAFAGETTIDEVFQAIIDSRTDGEIKSGGETVS